MPLEHIVWLKAKSGVTEGDIETTLVAVRNLSRLPGVLAVSAGRNITDRANGATHGAIITLVDDKALSEYLVHPDHKAVGEKLRQHCDVLAMDYEH